ncbi:MAG: hypothetical protein M3Z20_20155 [Chloroflexota bacterium]|nr:hypothetical protein [Chloroflexota bacterium]
MPADTPRWLMVAWRLAWVVAVGCTALFVWLLVRRVDAWQGLRLAEGGRDLISLMLALLGAVLAAAVAWSRPGPRNPTGRRTVSVVWSVAMLAALVFSWSVILNSHRYSATNGQPLVSSGELDAFMAEHEASFAPYDYLIPTGVYLQSFEFQSTSNVEMSGFVWQKYGPDVPRDLRRGIALPEQLENAYSPTPAWDITRNGVQEVGWYFSGQFRQNFDYREYPFDQQDIWLRLWHPEVDYSVMLVPDFAAYRDLQPETLPGLDTQFVYGGWDPVQTYFSYDLLDYNVDFGLDEGFSDAPDPELYFNLMVARDPLGPMLEHGVLEVAISILLFLLLLLMAHEATADRPLGVTVFDLIVAVGALLFAVILDHNSVRSAVQSQSLTYLEWFPLMLDIFIVLVVLDGVAAVKGWRIPILGYRGDLLPVLVYWPLLIGAFLLITLRTFFFPG